MPRAITRSAATGALCCILLALPASASAKRLFDIDHPGIAVEMSLHGSHGYRIKIKSVSHGRVRLTAKNDSAFAEYTVKGRVTRRALNANFGRLGRVSVRFHRIGKPRTGVPLLPVKCKGKNPIREKGRFEGTIRFHGEQGFTEVSARGVKGSVVRRFKRECPLPRGGRDATAAATKRPGDVTLTSFIAGARSHGRIVALQTVASSRRRMKASGG
jgi:hypothetical protein